MKNLLNPDYGLDSGFVIGSDWGGLCLDMKDMESTIAPFEEGSTRAGSMNHSKVRYPKGPTLTPKPHNLFNQLVHLIHPHYLHYMK